MTHGIALLVGCQLTDWGISWCAKLKAVAAVETGCVFVACNFVSDQSKWPAVRHNPSRCCHQHNGHESATMHIVLLTGVATPTSGECHDWQGDSWVEVIWRASCVQAAPLIRIKGWGCSKMGLGTGKVLDPFFLVLTRQRKR